MSALYTSTLEDQASNPIAQNFQSLNINTEQQNAMLPNAHSSFEVPSNQL